MVFYQNFNVLFAAVFPELVLGAETISELKLGAEDKVPFGQCEEQALFTSILL